MALMIQIRGRIDVMGIVLMALYVLRVNGVIVPQAVMVIAWVVFVMTVFAWMMQTVHGVWEEVEDEGEE